MATHPKMLSVKPPQNHTVRLIANFLRGDGFVSALSNAVFKTYDPIYPLDYEDTLAKVKAVLSQAKIDFYFKEVCRVSTSKILSDPEIAVLVRYVNICHSGKFIVVLNREIVYTPETYKEYRAEQVQAHVSTLVAEAERFARSKHWFSKAPRAPMVPARIPSFPAKENKTTPQETAPKQPSPTSHYTTKPVKTLETAQVW